MSRYELLDRRRINNCHPERSEESRFIQTRSFAALRMTVDHDSY